MRPLWNLIFGGVVGASVTAFVAILALSAVATDIAFGLIALWLLPLSALVGLFLGAELQGRIEWEQPCAKSLRHWFVGGATATILLYLVYCVVLMAQEGYKPSDISNRLFSLVVIPFVLCSFAGVVGGSVGLVSGVIFRRIRRQDVGGAE